jgi:aspartokinase-like uncharacterized kinase
MPEPAAQGLLVVKVGGSLYDLPDLGPKLGAWLDSVATEAILLVPGGGVLADVIRRLDAVHRLGEESAHWLALRALTLNAYWLAELLPGTAVIADPGSAKRRAAPQPPIHFLLDCFAFAQADEQSDGRLPHVWQITSDSIALRAAIVADAARLILLKSVTIPADCNWTEASQKGHVDPFFPRLHEAANVTVQTVNFRAWQVERQPAANWPGDTRGPR